MNVNMMDLLKQQKNRGYAIAGGAAIIAFIAFFLPYVTASYLGISNSASGSAGGWLWLEELGALAAIVIAAVLIFRNNAFGLSNMPVEKQIKFGRIALIGAGVLALILHLLFLIGYQSEVGGSVFTATSGLSIGLGFGYWVFMLATIGMIVGAVMAYRQPIAAYGAAAPQPYGQYGQPYPSQPTQYPPYQQQYPTADQQQPYQQQQYPAQPYPPQQPQYPPQQQQPYQQQYPGQPQQYPPNEMQPPQQYPQQR